MDKAEYAKKLKTLIKKYHPDLYGGEKNQALFHEITVALNQKLNSLKTLNPQPDSVIKDQAYACYRKGIAFYRNIHPDQFYARNAASPYTPVNYEAQLKALEKIFISFNLAEYYFRQVIDNYPKSEWKRDSEEKIVLLEKLWTSYENRAAEENMQTINRQNLRAFMKNMGIEYNRIRQIPRISRAEKKGW